jgi:hypothetical protein
LKRRKPAPRQLNENSSLASRRCQVLLGRARLTAELAERVLRPAEPTEYGAADWVACELYREAIHWALSAHRELHQQSAAAIADAPAPTAELESGDLVTLWSSVDVELLARAAGSQVELSRLGSELLGRSFVHFAALEPKRQTDVAELLRRFTEGLLAPLDTLQHRLERIWTVRLARVLSVAAALALALGVITLVAHKLLLRRDLQRDLSPQAAWTASSTYPEAGCISPLQRCSGSPNYFFHTHADPEGPWLLFDFGSEKTLSAIFVENRIDCCFERAVPLVVAVSSDKRRWLPVARRDSTFKTWRESFSRVEARWVKLSAPPGSNFHLATVRLIP